MPLWPHFSHCTVKWITSKLCLPSARGSADWGPIRGLGLPRPLLTTSPALPYPILLTLLFSFRMKKAGTDLLLRQFQGTLDLLKGLRPSLVALLASASLLFYKNLESSLDSVWLAVGHSPWFCDCVFFFVGL